MATRRFDFITGIESSDAPVATDPVNPSDPTTLGFSDGRYVQGGPPAANIAALKALDVSERQNGDCLLVISTGSIWRYNSTATTTPDDNYIVQPTAGAGRWVRVSDLDNFGNLDIPGLLNVTGNTTIGGNLTVNGTSTTINTSTLDIEDSNITVNKGGTEATAASNTAGLTVEFTDATNAVIVYRQGTTSLLAAGASDDAHEIVTTGHVQDFTAKKAFRLFPAEFGNIAGTPTTPVAGRRGLYSTAAGFKQIDDAGVITDLGGAGAGSGSGSGELNAIGSPSTADDWVASGAGLTVATTSTSSDLPLEGIIDTSIKITRVSGSDYVRYRYSMPDALRNRKLKLSWEQLPGAGYASGDFTVDVYTNTASDYSGTATRVPLASDSSSATPLPNATGKFQTSYDTNDSIYYELRINALSGTSDLNLANVITGPGIQPQGPVVTEWRSYTPTFEALGTVSNTDVKYRIVGDSLEIVGFTETGTVTADYVTISLPTGFTADNTKLSTFGKHILGVGTVAAAGSAVAIYGGSTGVMVIYDPPTPEKVFIAHQSATAASAGLVNDGSAGTQLFNSGSQFGFRFTIPVAQLTGTVNLLDTRVSDQNTQFYAQSTGNQAIATSTKTEVNFAFSDFNINEAYSTSTNEFTAPVAGLYSFTCGVELTGTTVFILHLENNSTNSFGQVRFPSGDTAYASTSGQLKLAAGDTVRVICYSHGVGDIVASSDNTFFSGHLVSNLVEGSAIGFGQVTGQAAGLMPAVLSNLDDVAATRMGLKSYAHGTTYNGGNAPTISGLSGLSIQQSSFIPYQMQGGGWRLKFNIEMTFTSGTVADFSVNGIVFAANNAVAVYAGAGIQGPRCSTNQGLGSFALRYTTASPAGFLSGDVPLSSKPTWAY